MEMETTSPERHKEPWLAVNLSSCVPGLGQMYSGSIAKGIAVTFLTFFLGDNSESSRDSRIFGLVKKSEIMGKAYKLFWPLNMSGPIGTSGYPKRETFEDLFAESLLHSMFGPSEDPFGRDIVTPADMVLEENGNCTSRTVLFLLTS